MTLGNKAYVSYTPGLVLDTSAWTPYVTDASVVEVSVNRESGRVDFAAWGNGTDQKAALVANAALNLTGSAFALKVASMTAMSFGDEFAVGIMIQTGKAAGDFTVGGNPYPYLNILTCEGACEGYYCTSTGGTRNKVFGVTWDPVNMTWFQIRESGGTIYWETSPDGSSWTSRATVATSAFTPGITALYPGPWGQCFGGSVVATASEADISSFVAAQAAIATSVVIMDSSDDVVASLGNGLPETISAPFAYGDSDQAIRDSLAAAIRTAASDSGLDVNFLE